MKIAVCVIATNKYKDYIQQLVRSIDNNFLTGHEVTIHIFADGAINIKSVRCHIIWHLIPSYGFPEATLNRYEIMTAVDYDADYIYYLDVDMQVCDKVGDEVLGDIVAVRHPGYFINNGWGSNNTPALSTAYLNSSKKKKYFAGGFQGGKKEKFVYLMSVLRDNIRADKNNGVMADFHDETHFNHFLASYKNITELDPSYCMPEAWYKRAYSKIDHLPAKILALEKEPDIR